ncbi:MAG: translation initiation factor 2, partial [Blautia sp.]
MKGSYRIIVQNAKMRYDFEIRRNLTVIRGNSATGKTTFIEMIREYYEDGISSGVELSCAKTCAVLSGRDWKPVLDTMRERIIFIDEGNSFVYTKEFARAVGQSDNYYVIVTREGLENLPYSVEEIYGIRESGKYATLKQTYNEL